MDPTDVSHSTQPSPLVGDGHSSELPPATRGEPPWLSLLYTTGMLLVGLALPGAPIAALCLYFEGTLDWPEAVRAGCWLIALVSVLGTALWVAASHLDRLGATRARR